jgi:hypothetical protein
MEECVVAALPNTMTGGFCDVNCFEEVMRGIISLVVMVNVQPVED